MSNVSKTPTSAQACDIMQSVARTYGYHGVCPEFLQFLVACPGDWNEVALGTGYSGVEVSSSYYQVMADLRAMFAPA